jgi:hypothetical protein
VTLEGLTLVSTTFIVASGVSLLVGWYFIRAEPEHGAPSRGHAHGDGLRRALPRRLRDRWAIYGSKHFGGTGIWRTIYFANPRPARHPGDRRRDRWPRASSIWRWCGAISGAPPPRPRDACPIWLYVAGSGWLVYYMLYRM